MKNQKLRLWSAAFASYENKTRQPLPIESNMNKGHEHRFFQRAMRRGKKLRDQAYSERHRLNKYKVIQH